jgi:uncharacterized UBP type Zn finger protein
VADPDYLEPTQKIVYQLQAMIAHPKNTVREGGMYTAIVKKKVEGQSKRQWIKYHKNEQKTITREHAYKHPCQMLIYALRDDLGEFKDDAEDE